MKRRSSVSNQTQPQGNDLNDPRDKKKPYAKPVLLEYGSVAKLTEGGQNSFPDNKNMRKKAK
jgi:hypothetical protein